MAAHHLKERLLVVDDAPDTREVVQRNLAAHGYEVFTAGNVAEAKTFLETTSVDMVITDLKMPGAPGLDLVHHVQQNLPDTAVMMITGYPFIAEAITAEHPGVEDYLAKPFTQDELLSIVRRRLDRLQAGRQAQESQEHAALVALIGESAPMRVVLECIENARTTDSPVMITGECGTGKALAARAIHYGSTRAAFPFLSIDAGSLSPSLADRELFGFSPDPTKGRKDGAPLFQWANGGTVFIRNVGALPMQVQVKLLHLLRQGELILGASTERIKVDVRILASPGRALSLMAEKEMFHPELLHRLSGATISMPPLRERVHDVGILVRHFIDKYAHDYGSGVRQISDQALALLQTYSWPGNVRELEDTVQRMVLASTGETIDAADLPMLRLSVLDKSRLRRTLADVETEYVQIVLASVRGNKSLAAEILGIDRKTLRKRLPPA